MRLLRSTILLGACLAVPAFPIDAVLTADTHVTPAQPSINFGRLPHLSVDAATQSVALLRFGLESLPPGTPHWQVARATLRVWVSRSTGPAGFSLGMASNPWDEVAVTHATRPATLTPNGSVHTAPTGANQWAALDVTYFVQLWLGGTPNHGFVLTPTHGTVFLSSKEGAASGHAPELDIVLSGPQGPSGPPGPQGLQGPRGLQGLPGTSSLVGRITRVFSTTDLGPGLQGMRFVSCPESHPQLIGGGCGHRDFNSAADDIHVNFTGPALNAPNSQWRCIFDNNASESRAVQTIAICSQ